MFVTQSLAYIGLGFSTVRGFTHYVDELEAELEKTGAKISNASVVFIDEMFKVGGQAYSVKTSPIPLLLHNALKDLTPTDGVFLKWVLINQERLYSFIKKNGGQWWLESNQADLESLYVKKDELLNAIDKKQTVGLTRVWREKNLFRAVYGVFLNHEFKTALNKYKALAEKYGFEADIKFVKGKVEDVKATRIDGFNQFTITVKTGDKLQRIKSWQLNFHPGFPAMHSFPKADKLPNYIPRLHEIYGPGFNGFDKLRELIWNLREQKTINLTFYGAGEAAADAWIFLADWLKDKPELKSKLKLTHISRNADETMRPPAVHSEKYQQQPYQPQIFITNFEAVNVASLMRDFAEEVRLGLLAGYTKFDIMEIVRPRFYKIIDGLCDSEKESFWSNQNTRMKMLKHGFFTTAETYKAKASFGDNLKFIKADANQVTFKEGAFLLNGQEYPNDIVINCAGFELYSRKMQPLTNLYQNGLVTFENSGSVIDFDPKRAAMNVDPEKPGYDLSVNGRPLAGTKQVNGDGFKRFTAAQQPQLEEVAKQRAKSNAKRTVEQNLAKTVSFSARVESSTGMGALARP